MFRALTLTILNKLKYVHTFVKNMDLIFPVEEENDLIDNVVKVLHSLKMKEENLLIVGVMENPHDYIPMKLKQKLYLINQL